MARGRVDALRLPWTGEFTPGQLGASCLAETLVIVAENEGVRDAIVEAIRSRWFAAAAHKRSDPGERLKQQRTRAGNVLNGMQSYGLVDDVYHLTELGTALLAEVDDGVRSDRFVTHLLKHQRGLELLDIARHLHSRRVRITNEELRRELRRRGYTVATNNADAGKLRQWLETVGVVDKRWRIDEERVAELTGTSLTVIGAWQSLTRTERAFLQTIRRLSETRGTRPVPSPELLDFVRDEHGPIFDEAHVKKVYRRLADEGWVLHFVKQAGRGGKGGAIAATAKVIALDHELLAGFRPGDLPAELRAAMTTPLETIYADLFSTDSHVKGIALELLAVNLATDLGLAPLRLRVRGVHTGGAEVDLVAEAAHIHFSRWLFQCKNTKAVDVSVLAKEVGMATLLRAHVVVIATTGRISTTVSTYAEQVNHTTPYQVVLIDGDALEEYRAGGALVLRERFRHDARAAMTRKRGQVLETLDDLAEDEA